MGRLSLLQTILEDCLAKKHVFTHRKQRTPVCYFFLLFVSYLWHNYFLLPVAMVTSKANVNKNLKWIKSLFCLSLSSCNLVAALIAGAFALTSLWLCCLARWALHLLVPVSCAFGHASCWLCLFGAFGLTSRWPFLLPALNLWWPIYVASQMPA